MGTIATTMSIPDNSWDRADGNGGRGRHKRARHDGKFADKLTPPSMGNNR